MSLLKAHTLLMTANVKMFIVIHVQTVSLLSLHFLQNINFVTHFAGILHFSNNAHFHLAGMLHYYQNIYDFHFAGMLHFN